MPPEIRCRRRFVAAGDSLPPEIRRTTFSLHQALAAAGNSLHQIFAAPDFRCTRLSLPPEIRCTRFSLQQERVKRMRIIQFLTHKIVNVCIPSIFALCHLNGTAIGLKKPSVSQKKLAFARATALGLDPAAEICRSYGFLSCCLQRANAKVLRGNQCQGAIQRLRSGAFFLWVVISRWWEREVIA